MRPDNRDGHCIIGLRRFARRDIEKISAERAAADDALQAQLRLPVGSDRRVDETSEDYVHRITDMLG